MQASREVDWVSAWYDLWAVSDAVISFWITATFAVLIAVHMLGDRATRSITNAIALLYTGFCIYSAFRVAQLMTEAQKVVEELFKEDIDLFAYQSSISWGAVGDYVLTATLLFGSIYTIYFVLTVHKRIDI